LTKKKGETNDSSETESIPKESSLERKSQEKKDYLLHFTDDSDNDDVNPNNYLFEKESNQYYQKIPFDFGDYTTAEDKDIPLARWIELPIGEILVPEESSIVWFGLNQFGLDWKYGLSIDYVALIPITMED